MDKIKIIDVHAHIGFSSSLKVGATPEKVIDLMDKNGINMAIISPIPGFEDPDGIQDVIRQNNNIAEIIKHFPERFPAGLGIIEPRHGKRALDELDRIFSDLNLSGLMFHNDYMGIALNDEIVYSIIERASKYKDLNIVIMAHTYHFSPLESPNRLAALAEAFPELTFIDAHPAMDVIQLEHSIYIAKNVLIFIWIPVLCITTYGQLKS